ncbi:putative Ankyrin repeat-containing protein [Melia azedarach]|uniref:Ankyrin repeat-containing protein n=1 Tax=Melia azedarach TaxID=155640 RepID=A0ACC1XJZ1_MELAZ|nr:putative Ankyrin repeat-containing protein [Melia azedarach]
MRKYSLVDARHRDELAAPSQKLIEAALSGDGDSVTACLKMSLPSLRLLIRVMCRLPANFCQLELMLTRSCFGVLQLLLQLVKVILSFLTCFSRLVHLNQLVKMLCLKLAFGVGPTGRYKCMLVILHISFSLGAICSLITPCCVKNGVDVNLVNRVLLHLFKPALHANVDCTPLVAAIVNWQVSMVKYLLEAGAITGCYVRIGAWSWDIFSAEELRVGTCLGRTLLSPAILCQNPHAACVLLNSSADVEFPVRTKKGHESCPLHLAARIGCIPILKQLILHGCQIDSRTETGDTALMLAAKADQADCFLELIISGADLGLCSPCCTLLPGTRNSELLQKMLQHSTEDINKCLTPVMIAAKAGHIEAFRLLINYGADISTKSRDGQPVVPILKQHVST